MGFVVEAVVLTTGAGVIPVREGIIMPGTLVEDGADRVGGAV